MTTNRRSLLRLLALLLSFVLIAAACGDDSGDSNDADPVDTGDGDDPVDDTGDGDEPVDDTGDGDEPVDEPTDDLTASWKGVTETSITLGIAMLDFEFLVSSGLSPAGWGDQQAVWQALIDDLNASGGVLGRTIEPVYESYSAVDPADATRACAVLTEDNDVFAVLGGFVGPLAGTVDPCITGLNDTILVGGGINSDELGQSTAPWFQPGATDEAATEILLGLLAETGRLDENTKVFVVGGQADESNHDASIEAFTSRDIEVVGDDIIIATDGDTAAQDSELQIITEIIKDVGATAVFIHGTPSASIRGLGAASLNETLDIWTNNAGGLNNLGATIADNSIADGVLTAAGPDDQSIWDSESYQTQCSEVVAAALPDADIRPPLDYEENDENWFNPIRRYCRHLDLFVQIALAAGAELTHDSFRAGAESLTDFSMPGSPAASLSADKLYAEDTYALQSYDSTAGDGQAVPIGDLVDAFPS